MEENKSTHHAADAVIDLVGGMAGRKLVLDFSKNLVHKGEITKFLI